MKKVLIVFVVFILIAVIGIAAFVVVNSNGASSNGNLLSQTENIVPVLNLSLDNEEEEQSEVTITAKATTEDSNGIYAITLPDESLVKSDEAVYKVQKNGTYEFKVEGKNGQTSSLSIDVTNIKETSGNEPYIPTGFEHTEGEVNNGFTIKDQYGNEFVWVPVSSGKLTRNTSSDSKYTESESTATELVNSVAQNYGFYIAKYESCACEKDGKTMAGSIGGQRPWTNVRYKTARKAAKRAAESFEYGDYKTALINSYAWDTTIKWLDKSVENYSSNTSYGNYSGEIKNTGDTPTDIVNNICDMAGNVREWTTEFYETANKKSTENNTSNNTTENNTTNEETEAEVQVDNHVVRGGSANLSRTASSHTGYAESMSDENWGFRMILYK